MLEPEKLEPKEKEEKNVLYRVAIEKQQWKQKQT